MSCKKCGGNRKPGDPVSDLKRYAYLTPRQLRYLKQLEGETEENEDQIGFVKKKTKE